jgi:hypothetical protein
VKYPGTINEVERRLNENFSPHRGYKKKERSEKALCEDSKLKAKKALFNFCALASNFC